MPTVYQRVLEYYKRPDAIKFSRNKISTISGFLAGLYDRKDNPLVGYVQSDEDGMTFRVRDYPDFFIQTIDKWICRNHDQLVNGTPFPWQEKGASFNKDRAYRYALWRRWDNRQPLLMFVGLNPSTANEADDDPTIRRVKKFAADWGYGGVYMMNLFAYVSTDPKQLLIDQKEKIGALNDIYLAAISKKCKSIVLAWGNFKVNGRDKSIIKMFPEAMCLGINKNGTPKHPLYLAANTPLVKFTNKD